MSTNHQRVADEVARYYPIPTRDEINLLGRGRLRLQHFPADRVIKEQSRFIRKCVARFEAKGILVGLSGGSDSSTLAMLARRVALDSGFEALTATLVARNPTKAESQDMEAARALAARSCLNHIELDASEVIAAFDRCVSSSSVWGKINRSARLRFDLLNCVAEDRGLLMLDSINRSEYILGAFTEPLGLICPFLGLFKTEVRRLGKELGVPQSNLERDSVDSEKNVLTRELYGAGWDVLDPVLYLLFDRKFSSRRVSRLLGHSNTWVQNIRQKRIEGQAHRRDLFHPLHPRLGLGDARMKDFFDHEVIHCQDEPEKRSKSKWQKN